MNNQAQFQSILLAIISIFIVGVLLLFVNRLNDEIFTEFDVWLNDSDYNGTEAQVSLQKIHTVDNSIWDYAFLALFIGYFLQVILFSFGTRINLAFYWVMVILDIPILILGVIVSNIWQELAVNPEFVTTIVRFPITNLLLGTYFPLAVLTLITISSIILFGKRPGN